MALDRVKKVLLDDEVMNKIKEEHYLSPDASEEDYVRLREVRIRAVLEVAKVDFDMYHKYLAMNRMGVKVVLQRDIAEININNYNPQWLEFWDANMDLSPVKDFFAVITYITEYAFKPEPQEIEMRRMLESVNDKTMEEKMKVVAQAFQDTREMGYSEAIYKLLPELLMTNSNVKKQWVCVGREEERTTRARKATKEDVDGGRDVFELDGVEGKWIEQWDMRSKYMRRDPEFWALSFCQFARMMEAKSGKEKEEEESNESEEEDDPDTTGDDAEGKGKAKKDEPWYAPFYRVMVCSHQCCTDQQKEGCEGECCNAKPKRSKLKKAAKKPAKPSDVPEEMVLRDVHVGEPKLMKRRKIPAVLRFYKSNKETNPIRFFLQELILFVPFGLKENGDTKNLLQAPDDQVVLLYEKYSEHIKEVKNQVLPFLEDVTEERFYVEEMRRQMDLEQIGMEIAAGKELDNMEALDAEVRKSFVANMNILHMNDAR